MKLINILDNLDILSEVVIWNFDEAEDTNWVEPTFEGCVMNVPYYLTKTNLLTPEECEEHDIEGPMRTTTYKRKTSLGTEIEVSALVIFVKEK